MCETDVLVAHILTQNSYFVHPSSPPHTTGRLVAAPSLSKASPQTRNYLLHRHRCSTPSPIRTHTQPHKPTCNHPLTVHSGCRRLNADTRARSHARTPFISACLTHTHTHTYTHQHKHI